jgi:hypothetical protein
VCEPNQRLKLVKMTCKPAAPASEKMALDGAQIKRSGSYNRTKIPETERKSRFFYGGSVALADISPVGRSGKPIRTPIFWHPNSGL